MKFLKKYSAAILITFLVLGIFATVVPHLVNAQSPTPSPTNAYDARPTGAKNINFKGCISSPVTCSLYLVTLFFTYIGSYLIALSALFLQYAYSINDTVMSLEAVRTGFGIALGIANMGFVLGIIIIAIATILRIESYGMKHLLTKLIVMAILVNFSMTAAGVILGTSRSFATYFLKASSNDGDVTGMVDNLAAGFGPQRLYDRTDYSQISNQALAEDGTSLGTFFGQLANMLFIVLFLLLIAFTFLVLAIMLAVRFVYIGILLILMPIAWMCWVFPDLSSHWHSWWNQFLRWAFFPPIVLFFVYLAMATAGSKSPTLALENRLLNNPKGPGGALENMSANITAALRAAGQMTMLLGLLFGGFIAANSLGIAGAAQATNMVKSAGNWVGKRALSAGTHPLRRGIGKSGKSIAQRLTDRATAQSRFGRAITLNTLGWAARGATRLAAIGGEKLVEEEHHDVAKEATPEVHAERATATGQRLIAVYEELLKRKELSSVSPEEIARLEGLFKENNKAAEFDELKEGLGITKEVLDLVRDNSADAADRWAEFFEEMKKEDAEKIPWNAIFSRKTGTFGIQDDATLERLAKTCSRALSLKEANQALVPGAMRAMKGQTIESFKVTYGGHIKLEGEEAEENWKAQLANYIRGGTGRTKKKPAAGGAPPAAPAGGGETVVGSGQTPAAAAPAGGGGGHTPHTP